MRAPSLTFAAALAALMVLAGCAGPKGTGGTDASGPAIDYAAIVASPDRAAADRTLDARRGQPQLLAFTGVRPGMRVLDMDTGAGYTTELLARVVGDAGVVHAQEGPEPNARAHARLEERLKTPAMARVQRAARPFDDPVPPGAAPLDLVTFFFGYHDTAFMPVDRQRMNRRVFEALRPGGVYVVADHSARAGDGTSVASTLHRIEEATVVREVQAAGFVLAGRGEFLRNPADPRTANVFRNEQRNDEFVLRFVKPR